MLTLIWSHWLADFVAQTDEMAINKSKSLEWLIYHAMSYTLALIVTMTLVTYVMLGTPLHATIISYGLLNGFLHGLVDYGTSKWTSKLWNDNKRHDFFVIVGLDQGIHMTILFITARLFGFM